MTRYLRVGLVLGLLCISQNSLAQDWFEEYAALAKEMWIHLNRVWEIYDQADPRLTTEMCDTVRRAETILRRKQELLSRHTIHIPNDQLMTTPMELLNQEQAEVTNFAQRAQLFAYHSIFRNQLGGCPE